MTWTTAEARSVACPKCKAPIGAPCRRKGERHHQARIDAMVAVRRAKRPKRGNKAAPLTQPVTITGRNYVPPRKGEVMDFTDVF